MKTSRGLKIYLTVVTALLIVALGFGVYVWYVFQSLKMSSYSQEKPFTQTADTTRGEESRDGAESVETTPPAQPEPKIIPVSSLSEAQRDMLKTFGIDSDTLVISSEMIACAEQAVGEERLTAITNGAAPSPLEAIKMAPCFKE